MWSASRSTTHLSWLSFRFTSPTPIVRMGLQTITVVRQLLFAWAACMLRHFPMKLMVHADAIFLGPGEQTFAKFLQDFRAGKPERVYTSAAGRSLERVPAIRRDLIPESPLPGTELHRGHTRLPPALRLLLQGRLFPGRPAVLHPAGGGCAGRNRAATRTSPLFPGRSSVGRPALCRSASLPA